MSNYSTQVSHTRFTQEQNLDFMRIDPSSTQIDKPSKNANRSLVYSHLSVKLPNMRRSLKDNQKGVGKEQANPSFLQIKTDTINKLHKSHQFSQSQMQQIFKCQNCISSNQSTCTLCLGNRKFTKDSALIKFFSYLIQFKLGRNQSYIPVNQTQKTNDSCIRDSVTKQKTRMSLNDRKNECFNIHYSYYCNECDGNEPIIGQRFQCLVCQDYDLCENCYKLKGHQHRMNQIKQSTSYTNSIKCIQRINKEQEIFSSRKIHNLRNRISNIEQKIYKSSLR